jgi:phosphohistidine phosphatase
VKQLSLLRHASAVASPADGNDFERPLTARGLTEASSLGRHLHCAGAKPDLLTASPALRTRHTAEALANELSMPPERMGFDLRLYLAEPEEILRVVRAAPAESVHLVIVGHNPGLSQLASWLGCNAGHGEFEPAGGCTLTLEVACWEDVSPAAVRRIRRERILISPSGS